MTDPLFKPVEDLFFTIGRLRWVIFIAVGPLDYEKYSNRSIWPIDRTLKVVPLPVGVNLKEYTTLSLSILLAQSAGTAEYTDCILEEG